LTLTASQNRDEILKIGNKIIENGKVLPILFTVGAVFGFVCKFHMYMYIYAHIYQMHIIYTGYSFAKEALHMYTYIYTHMYLYFI
jgi:hypothetical protein